MQELQEAKAAGEKAASQLEEGDQAPLPRISRKPLAALQAAQSSLKQALQTGHGRTGQSTGQDGRSGR